MTFFLSYICLSNSEKESHYWEVCTQPTHEMFVARLVVCGGSQLLLCLQTPGGRWSSQSKWRSPPHLSALCDAGKAELATPDVHANMGQTPTILQWLQVPTAAVGGRTGFRSSTESWSSVVIRNEFPENLVLVFHDRTDEFVIFVIVYISSESETVLSMTQCYIVAIDKPMQIQFYQFYSYY